MNLDDGVRALQYLKQSYTDHIKKALEDKSLDQDHLTRLAQIREGVELSIKTLEKIRDK